MGLYFVGDSAYSIRSFLLVPFDNAAVHGAEDAFNYHHSTCRIWVECAFGEIDMRWGILWKPLPFSLSRNVKVIDATMRMHNYIVERRLRDQSGLEEGDVVAFRQETENFLIDNHHEVIGVVIDNDVTSSSEQGRLPRHEETYKQAGKQLRQELSVCLKNNECRRPSISSNASWYRDRYNRTVAN